MPARTSPGQTRSILPLQYPGSCEKLARDMRIGKVDVRTMKHRSGEVVEMASRRHLDLCCLQETEWKEAADMIFGKYKFFWSGCEEGTAGVGLLGEEKWVERVLEVRRVSSRIMVVRVGSIKNITFRLISVMITLKLGPVMVMFKVGSIRLCLGSDQRCRVMFRFGCFLFARQQVIITCVCCWKKRTTRIIKSTAPSKNR